MHWSIFLCFLWLIDWLETEIISPQRSPLPLCSRLLWCFSLEWLKFSWKSFLLLFPFHKNLLKLSMISPLCCTKTGVSAKSEQKDQSIQCTWGPFRRFSLHTSCSNMPLTLITKCGKGLIRLNRWKASKNTAFMLSTPQFWGFAYVWFLKIYRLCKFRIKSKDVP